MTAMPNSSLVGFFEDRQEAEQAVDELEQAGFSHDDVHLAIRGEDAVRGGMITDAQAVKDRPGAAMGIVYGGLIGGILGAIGAFAVSYGESHLASGILSTLFGYAAAGVAVGGILGAMMGLARSEREAHVNVNRFPEGRAIVSVRASHNPAAAEQILRQHGARDIHLEATDPLADPHAPPVP